MIVKITMPKFQQLTGQHKINSISQMDRITIENFNVNTTGMTTDYSLCVKICWGACCYTINVRHYQYTLQLDTDLLNVHYTAKSRCIYAKTSQVMSQY